MTELFDTIHGQFDRLLSSLMQPVYFISDPSKRIYWLYALMSIVIAGLVYVYRDRDQWWSRLHHHLLSGRLWFNPSTFLDVKLILVKSVVRGVFFASSLVSSYGIAVWLVQAATHRFGAVQVTSFSDVTIAALYMGVLFVCSDFSRYYVHRLCHRIPILWQFHQVHHSAEVMTPLTLYRSHPVENLIFVARGIVVTGVVAGLFFYLFETRAVQMQVLGVNALGLLFNMLGANLRHSHVWISYGSFLEHLFISPAQHQIHHSTDPQHHGTNYGSCFALWDWMGGSLYIAGRQEPLRFGLPEADRNHDPHRLTSALVGPFVGCWRLIRRQIQPPVSRPSPPCDLPTIAESVEQMRNVS